MDFVHAGEKCFAIEGARIARLFPCNQCLLQSAHLGFMLFEQAKSRTHHIAGRAVATGLDLVADEAGEVVPVMWEMESYSRGRGPF